MELRDYEDLKKKVDKKLEEFSTANLSLGEIDAIDRLTHTIKNLCVIIEKEEEKSESGGMWNARGSYDNSRNDSYSGRHYVRGHYSRAAESMKKGIEEMIQDPSLSMSEKDTLSRAMDIIR